MTWPPYGQHLLALVNAPLTPDILRKLVCEGERADLEVIASLWLTEGIPQAFVEHPALYEHLRRELGCRLDVPSKNVSITGSRRIGYSMNPTKWGARMTPKSDFDLFVVDEVLFKAVAEDFHRWAEDFRSGRCVPKHNGEWKWWPVNAEEGPTDIKRGYINPVMRIPNGLDYLSRERVGIAITEVSWELRRLAEHIGARGFSSSMTQGRVPLSLRVYRSWDSAIQGVRRSLIAARYKLASGSSTSTP